MTKTVGQFTIKDGSLYGPKEYMDEQGNAKLDEILAGNSIVFNTATRLHPDQDIETSILVALQTDFAGWKGKKLLLDGALKYHWGQVKNMAHCDLCRVNWGKEVPATHLAPQTDGKDGHTWVPVCDCHLDGWFEDCEGLNLPPAKKL